MPRYKMINLAITGPILPGCVSTARSTCGKLNCRCKQDDKYRHGTYYRWTGAIDGRQTTKTISRKEALECARRIKNYRALQQNLNKLLDHALKNAPWHMPVRL